jgi:peptide/nickel transport system permease protein
LAPLLATDRAWLARTPEGLRSPALSAWLGRPGPGPGAGADTLIPAPVPYAPNRLDLDTTLARPSRQHWLGTDVLGRDLTARVIHGGRISLSVGLLAAASALLLGVPLGAVAGYRGGLVDAAVSRGVEAVLCFPALLLALALLAAAPGWLGRLPDVPRIALVIGLTGWVPVARYVRGEFLTLRDSEMVLAARAAGVPDLRVIVRHILPSALAPVLITAAFAVAGAMALEASLSFLGLGVRPPVASWGGLLADAREQVDRAWWLALSPGAALSLALLSCTLVGEGLRDLLDPRRGR